jgi:hypothetical protein
VTIEEKGPAQEGMKGDKREDFTPADSHLLQSSRSAQATPPSSGSFPLLIVLRESRFRQKRQHYNYSKRRQHNTTSNDNKKKYKTHPKTAAKDRSFR